MSEKHLFWAGSMRDRVGFALFGRDEDLVLAVGWYNVFDVSVNGGSQTADSPRFIDVVL